MSRFFVNRPIVAMVISIIIVVGGLLAMRSLPVAQYPSIIPPQIIVSTTFTGADAVTVEQSVATPLEQQMNGVDDMLYMQSTNANDGTMQLTVTFDIDTDPNIDQVNVSNRVAQAQPNLPPDVNQFGLAYRKSTGLPMLIIALYSPHQRYDSLFLANYANININDALYRVRGVGEVRLFGASDYAMRIWLKPDVLAKLGLTVPDLVRAVSQQSTVNPAGRVGAEPAPPGQQLTYTVRARGRLVTPEEFGNVVVRLTPDGSAVRLRDVARIELGALTYNQSSRFNGRPAALVAVFQAPGANALAVAAGVKQVMRELHERFPSDMEYEIGLDTTRPVTEGIKEIVITILEAMALVILVVFLFLQNWRATLIPLIAVPVSLVGTFALFPFLGFSVNTLSLFALVLAIGLVVDDAIVVVEAVEHHIEEGLAPREATLKAMSEVSGPVVGIALVLSAVFIPIALIGGIQGRLNQQFAVTIAIAVLISAFNALSLSPALSAMLLRPRRESRGLPARFFGAFNRGFARATHGYVDLSHGLVRKTALSLLLLVGFALLAGGLGRRLPTGFIADEDQGFLLMNVQLPDAASLQRTVAVTGKIEGILKGVKGVRGIVTINGFSLLTRTSASYTAFFFVALDPWHERRAPGLSSAEIMATLNRALQSEVPEDIGRFYVRNNDGNMLPLSTVVTSRRVFGPEYTQRFNLFRAAQITGQPAPGYSSGQAMTALEEVAQQVLPPEMGYDWADLSFQERRAAGRAGAVFGLSLGFVFLILAALYESWSLPFSVLLSVPVAVVGAFLGLWGRGFALDVYGQIGLVMLIGLAAKNAILIVEFAKDGLERGQPLVDAALQGARIRLRPILMTSFAFILGCVPLWIAKGAGAAGRRILGTTVISGMLAATGIAIFLIPVLFVAIERLSGAERRHTSPPDRASAPAEA